MVYRTIVHDEHTLWARVWVHVFKELFNILKERIPIERTSFDLCINKTLAGEGRKNCISKRA